jgi:outer membrane protein assembly factor BamA
MRLPLRALATLLLAVPLAAHAQYSIATVTFQHPGPYTHAELLAASGLEPGQALMHDSLGNAAQRLLNTGLFSDAEIDYTGTGKARDIVVDLKPIALDKLLPASFENLVWFTRDELTAGIHAHVPLYRGVASDAGTLPDDIQSALQQMLVAKGITATLSHAIIEPTNPHPLRVISFRIEQPSIRLNTVHLSILEPIAAHTALTPGFQQGASTASRNPFNEGLSGLTLQDSLLSSARSAGYIQATLDNLQCTVAPSPTDPQTLLATCSARIVTGDSYKVSSLTFSPTPLYSAADFARDAKLHTGDLASDAALRDTEAPISNAYLLQGYIHAYITSNPVIDPTAHTVAYTLRVVPGEVYRLETLTVTGLSPSAQKAFDTAWTMKAGDPYSEMAVNIFIRKNIAQPAFQPYSLGYSASFDPDTHLVDLTLTFTPNGSKAY